MAEAEGITETEEEVEADPAKEDPESSEKEDASCAERKATSREIAQTADAEDHL